MMFNKNKSFTIQMRKLPLQHDRHKTEELELKVTFPLLHMDGKQAKKVPTFFCLYLVINIQESIIYV